MQTVQNIQSPGFCIQVPLHKSVQDKGQVQEETQWRNGRQETDATGVLCKRKQLKKELRLLKKVKNKKGNLRKNLQKEEGGF